MKTLKSLITRLREKLISLFRTKKNKPLILKGEVVLKAGVLNKNGRVYSHEAMLSMHNQIQEKIKKPGTFLGEFGYPAIDYNFDVSLNKVSHTITDSRIEGDLLKVDLRTLDVPSGNILREFLEKTPKSFVFRPRGHGHLSPAGKVGIDYKIVSIDAIPATDDAFLGII